MDTSTITDESFIQLLERAGRVVSGSDIAPEFESIAFEQVVASLLNQASNQVSREPTVDPQQNTNSEHRSQDGAGLDLVDRIAAGLNIDSGLVERVYREVNGQPHLNLSTAKIPAAKSAATRDIALLVVAARSALNLDPDDYTPVKEIRAVLEDYNRHDSANFASIIREMNNYFRFRGENQSRSVKLNTPGREAALELIARLGGDN